MALVKCPECGREKVSDSAVVCPDCGFGVKKYYETIKEREIKEKEKLKHIETQKERKKI